MSNFNGALSVLIRNYSELAELWLSCNSCFQLSTFTTEVLKSSSTSATAPLRPPTFSSSNIFLDFRQIVGKDAVIQWNEPPLARADQVGEAAQDRVFGRNRSPITFPWNLALSLSPFTCHLSPATRLCPWMKGKVSSCRHPLRMSGISNWRDKN